MLRKSFRQDLMDKIREKNQMIRRSIAILAILVFLLASQVAVSFAADGDPSQWGVQGDPSQWGVAGEPSQWGIQGDPSQW